MQRAAPPRHVLPERQVADCLLHPVIVGALILWLVNDHLLKGMYPGWLTGKLSDVVSLMVFPLLPIAALDLWQRRNARADAVRTESARRWLRGWSHSWIAATGLVMATINTLDSAALCYRWGLAAVQWPVRVVLECGLYGHGLPALVRVRLTMDPSDLLTLPALAVPLWLVLSATPRVSQTRPAASQPQPVN